MRRSLCISPYDCSANSDLASYRPKRSASIMPRVSYFENARIKLGFFPVWKVCAPYASENIAKQYSNASIIRTPTSARNGSDPGALTVSLKFGQNSMAIRKKSPRAVKSYEGI